MRVLRLAVAVGCACLVTAPAAFAAPAWPHGTAVVGYRSEPALAAALRTHPATIVRRLPALRAVAVRPATAPAAWASAVRRARGIRYVEPVASRAATAEPALAESWRGAPFEWQYAATRTDLVPAWVLRAASSVTIAVVDTGADLAAPDLGDKAPDAYNVRTGDGDVRDVNGHGTFVASLAAGSVVDGAGIAGFGGDAHLLVVKAGRADGSFSDVDEASAIVYAVQHGAHVINLSVGGPSTSTTERRAVDYAIDHGVLLVAAAGNEHEQGNPVEYPAALLQPAGSDGLGGRGLSVGASTAEGRRASFSNTGSYISLVAPGENVFGALSSLSSPALYPRVPLAGPGGGLYGFASGTSFAAPQVAGAAALVWAANPSLDAAGVATILKETASGLGTWSGELGFGVVDSAGAVARALGGAAVLLSGARVGGRVHLSWTGAGAGGFRVRVSRDDRAAQVVVPSTAQTDGWFRVDAGHAYVFTVTALGTDGAEISTSAPLAVRAARAEVSLSLAASASRGHHPLSVSLTATLRPHAAAVPRAARRVTLEFWNRRGWHGAATAATTGGGHASWRLRLGPGTYRVRVVYRGGSDLARASSRAVSLRVN